MLSSLAPRVFFDLFDPIDSPNRSPHLEQKNNLAVELQKKISQIDIEKKELQLDSKKIKSIKPKPGKLKSGIQVVATDISQTVLTNAKSGEYEMLAIGRGLSKERLNAYFIEQKTGAWKIKPELRRQIDFRLLNLLDRYSILGKFDVIFCRNVVIYFNKETQKELFERLADQLHDGGYLFIGHSETLHGMTSRFESKGRTIYKKIR